MIHLSPHQVGLMCLIPRMKGFSDGVHTGSRVSLRYWVTTAMDVLGASAAEVKEGVRDLLAQELVSRVGDGEIEILPAGGLVGMAAREWVIDHGKKMPGSFDELLSNSEVLGKSYRDAYRAEMGMSPTPREPESEPVKKVGLPVSDGSPGVVFDPRRGSTGKISHAHCGHGPEDRRACRKYAEERGI